MNTQSRSIPFTRERVVSGRASPFSPLSRTTFLIIAVYLVLPVFDVPLLGLSISAPLFFFLVYEIFGHSHGLNLKPYRTFLIIAVFLWLAITLSALLNGLRSGGVAFDNDSVLSIVRYAYWLLFFAVTAIYVTAAQMGKQLAAVLGWSIFALALLRLGEVVLYGNIGAWTGSRLMTQNAYGFLFSCYTPFCLLFIFNWKRSRRWLAWGMSVIIIIAVLLNGSRGSWVGTGIGAVVLLITLFTARPRLLGRTILPAAAAFGVVAGVLGVWAPASEAFQSRYSTMSKLEEDKSYAIRLLMNQKALRLFQENPLIGVGPDRFRKSSTPLEIPKLLSYNDQSHFDVKSAHNSYLSFLAETGIAGALPMTVLLLILTLKGIRSSILIAKQGELWAAAVYASFISMSVHMWVISSLTNTANWFIYGLVGALIITARQIKRHHASAGRQTI